MQIVGFPMRRLIYLKKVFEILTLFRVVENRGSDLLFGFPHLSNFHKTVILKNLYRGICSYIIFEDIKMIKSKRLLMHKS